MIYLLQELQKGNDIFSSDSLKIRNLISTIERKNLICDKKVTDLGKSTLDLVFSKNGKKLRKIIIDEDEWGRFLKAYPPNNKFTWKNKEFHGDRSIRKNTNDGKILFSKIIENEKVTCDDLINAVIAESLNKFNSSFISNQNKMNYFINTESWLRQKQYLNWLDDGRTIKDSDKVAYFEAFKRKKETNSKSFDI